MSRFGKRNNGDHVEFGIMLILVGCGFLAYKMGYINNNWYWWELVAGAAGILGTIRLIRARDLQQAVSAVFQIAFAVVIYGMFENLWGLNFYIHWPILLIGLGLSSLTRYALGSKDKADRC
ncbi:hypothetical protein H8K35_01765 [Undibacterium sp. LX40W]|uniref:LiaF transmembrane domain-containing protein n=1 Tax=Undibacterium nitidum TaxID=2762298 RepID=A0A923KS50_9BURK|nr:MULTISPECIES: hypothetical protein [Undibacterium]MBC3880891.1 hypothetical protein [Undibacterium nitidum]MBC3890376.1 hypothetical protein [Undibacterium sp. LX40W]